MKLAVRNKIIIIFAAALLVTNILNLLFISRILKKDFSTSLNSELSLLGDNLQTQLKRITSLGMSTSDIEGFGQQCLELVRKNEHLTQAMIVDRQGTIIFHNISSRQGQSLPYSRILASIQKGKTEVFSVFENGENYYYAVLPYGDNPGYSNEYAVVISSSSNVVNDRILSVIKSCAYVILLTFVISMILLFVILSFILNEHKQVEEREIMPDESECETPLTSDDKVFQWIWEVDINGLYTYCSSGIEELLGYKPQELVGKKHFYDMFIAQEREKLKNLALERFAEKLPFEDFLNANMHKNGKIVWLMTAGVPILDEHGNLIGYRGSDVNVSQRKKYCPAVVGANTGCADFGYGAGNGPATED